LVETVEVAPGEHVLVIDNFMPPQVAAAAEAAARASTRWKPGLPPHQQEWARWRASEKELFAPSYVVNTFPGLRTDMTDEYVNALKHAIKRLPLRKTFGERPKRFGRVSSAFSNICYSPDALAMATRSPHIDQGPTLQDPVGTQVGGDTGPVGGEPLIAVTHYLSSTWEADASAPGANTSSGGTAFYRERASGASLFSDAACAAVAAEARSMAKGHAPKLKPGGQFMSASYFCHNSPAVCCWNIRQSMDENPAWRSYYADLNCQNVSVSIANGQGYPAASTDDFELLHAVPYRWNRAVIYSTKQLVHSAYLDTAAVKALSTSPQLGRLSANIFLAN
jgi:hypothetical protein